MPLLTLDAVRVSRRKLDASRDATRRQGDTLLSPLGYTRGSGRGRGNRGSRGRGKSRGSGGRSGTSSGRNESDGPVCMICKDNHNLYDNPVCKKKCLDYKYYLGEQAARFQGPRNNDDDDPGSGKDGNIGTSYWSDPPKSMKTVLMYGIQSSMTIADSNCDAIVDGGATGTVIGIRQYHDLCEALYLMPNIMKASSRHPQWHSFGSSGNTSNREQVVGNARIPIPCGKGRLVEIETFFIDGNVPFILAKLLCASCVL